MMMFRGVRGATSAKENSEDAIIEGAKELLLEMIAANGIEEDTVASVFFTSTPDLTAAYPARAARQIGWVYTALMGCQEMDIPDGLPRCIRILIHWNTQKAQQEIRHIYLHDAEQLRPDWANKKELL